MLTGEQLRIVRDHLDGAVGLLTLYVFGSVAAGTANRESDIDLAAIFARPVEPVERLRLAGELSEALGHNVDLVDLDLASPIIAMQVLRYGVLCMESDRRRRVAFEAAVPGRYEDVCRIRAAQVDAMLRRTAHGGS